MQHQKLLLLPATGPTVQEAQRRTTTAYLIAVLVSGALCGWHYAVWHHVPLSSLAVIAALFVVGRIGGYFICRLEPRWVLLATLPAWMLLIVSALVAAIRPLH